MFKQGVKLNNSDGSFRCYITQGEARRGVKSKEMRKVRVAHCPQPVYQLVAYPDPSNSNNDQTSISGYDTQLLIGMKRIGSPKDDRGVEQAQKRLERLIGFGLLPSNTCLPASGYLS